jgi:CheY-like chemotaxis protein
MHRFTLPAIPITSTLQADIEHLLGARESISEFVLTSVLESLERRRQRAAVDAQAAATQRDASPQPNAKRPLSVLVVDDDDFSQTVLREMLLSLGVSDVYTARDGSAGASVLADMPNPPDFLLCDMIMPNTDGIDFLGNLAKSQYRGGIILLSGGDSLMMSIAAEVAASDGLRVLGSFAKPLERDALADVMGLTA